MGEYQPDVKQDDALLSARGAARRLGIGRNTFKRLVDNDVFRGVKDPVSGRVRYHLPTLRTQFAEKANGPTPVDHEGSEQ